MNAEIMRPFVLETIKTFEQMLGVRPVEKEPETKKDTCATYDISAIIGISGSGTGAVVMSFPEDVACKAVTLMLKKEVHDVDTDVCDGLGELINIIAGNAKRRIIRFGFKDLILSSPNVVTGKDKTVWSSSDMPCLMVRFNSSELGAFCIEVSIRAN